jgi:hypothetical protein
VCFCEQEPLHNIRAPVFRALLGQQLGDPKQKEMHAAAVAAVERGEAGAPAAFWYRFAGAQGGTSVADLRSRLGLPPLPPPPPAGGGESGGKGRRSKRKGGKKQRQKKHKKSD